MLRPARRLAAELLEDRTTPEGLDPTFGVNGQAIPWTPPPADTPGYPVPWMPRDDIAKGYQSLAAGAVPDGKTLLVGLSYTPAHRFTAALIRMNPDGSRDVSFGPEGQRVLPTPPGDGSRDFYPTSAAVLPDGRVVVAGMQRNATFVVARLTADGVLDPTFDGDGWQIVTAAPNEVAHVTVSPEALAVGPDGAIILAGNVAKPDPVTGFPSFQYPDLFVARLTAAGALDAGFGGDGTVTLPVPQPDSLTGPPSGWDIDLTTTLAQADGRIVFVWRWWKEWGAAGDAPLVVARLNADGTPDAGFGQGGSRTVPFDAPRVESWTATYMLTTVQRAALQPNGRIVLVGSEDTEDGFRAAVVRLTANGADDPTFGEAGRRLFTFGPGESIGAGLAVLPDGRVVVTGVALATGSFHDAAAGWVPQLDLGAALLTRNGDFDPGLGDDGRLIVAFAEPAGFDSVATTTALSDGRVVVTSAGVDGFRWAVRLTTDPAARDEPVQLSAPRGLHVEALGSRLRLTAADDTELTFAPYEDSFVGELSVVTADLNGDGVPEIVVAPRAGGAARVQVFALVGGECQQRDNFFAFAGDEVFRGGANLAVGDVNADGVPDLVVSAGAGGGPRVAVFDGRGLLRNAGAPDRALADFFAFADPGFLGGVSVAIVDVTGDSAADLVAGAGTGGAPRVVVFDGTLIAADQPAACVADFFAGDQGGRDGVRVTAADLPRICGTALGLDLPANPDL